MGNAVGLILEWNSMGLRSSGRLLAFESRGERGRGCLE